jgi:protein required for attachment to host cells
MSRAWVVAADSSRARILSAEKRNSDLVEVEDLVHTESRLHEQDLKSDAPGRAFDSAGQGRHAMEPKNSAKQQEALRFAKQVCETLTSAHGRGQFDKLYIVAAPSFLGLLRECLNPVVQHKIAGEISKNLSAHTPEEIRGQLPDYL